MKRILLSAGLVMTTLLPSVVFAQQSGTPSCLDQVYSRMGYEERLYRSVLFGQKKSSELKQGSVRYDTEYDTWIKTGNNAWKSLDEGNTGLTWSDGLMDDEADIPERRGLFEVRKTPTSDLIPPLLQSVRALQCRLRAVCAAAAQAGSAEEDAETIDVQTDGCLEYEMPVFRECAKPDLTEISTGTCGTAVEAILERETKLLEMVVAYDAAYRSLAQFAGIFEGFLTDFRFPLIQPLWQMVRTLGALDGLPCFNAQCDE